MAIDESVYEAQRRAVSNRYSTQAASNALGRFIGQQRSGREIGDYQRDFGRQAPRFTANYTRRGLAGSGIRSGVYNTAMRNYVGDYQQNLNRMYADQSAQMNQYDLNTANYEAERQAALADIETQKQRDIANAAAYLSALKGQFGG